MSFRFARCTTCTTPAPSNVRRLGAKGELFVLARCTACGNVVDSHTELEPALVALDVLLAKRKAIRHCIFTFSTSTMVKLAAVLVLLRSVWIRRMSHSGAAVTRIASTSPLAALAALHSALCAEPASSGLHAAAQARQLLWAVAIATGELGVLVLASSVALWFCDVLRATCAQRARARASPQQLRFFLRALVVGALPACCVSAGALVWDGYGDAWASVALELSVAVFSCVALASVVACSVVTTVGGAQSSGCVADAAAAGGRRGARLRPWVDACVATALSHALVAALARCAARVIAQAHR